MLYRVVLNCDVHEPNLLPPLLSSPFPSLFSLLSTVSSLLSSPLPQSLGRATVVNTVLLKVLDDMAEGVETIKAMTAEEYGGKRELLVTYVYVYVNVYLCVMIIYVLLSGMWYGTVKTGVM